MLFNTEPKASLSELYDRELEIERFKKGINERLILVLGLRRIGKSSLVLSVLNSLSMDYLFIDVRKLYDNVSKKVPVERIYDELKSSLGKLSFKERLKDLIKDVDVSLGSVGVRLRSSETRNNIVRVFDALNDVGKRIIIVFDEAQYLRYSTSGLRPLLAYIYDNLRNITLVLTGSEVGLLHDFLGIDDPSSELYGRYFFTVELTPFNREKSIDFLRRGFAELNINVEDYVLEKAVNELDGIVGWLTYFGKLYLDKGLEALDEVKELGINMVKSEIEELYSRSQYYQYIMEAAATLEEAKWSDILRYIMAKTGRRPTNATLSRDLRNLVKMGFLIEVNDKYRIPDPIVKYAVLNMAR
ncbi:MAG: AAA family ATPase [Caldivirga sp.]|uniref:AAA family ATPase n=1 Tax=Caldivirga sp. TaxID=2080243 RepID=UPI003D104F0D